MQKLPSHVVKDGKLIDIRKDLKENIEKKGDQK